jgi:hypothetical protein
MANASTLEEQVAALTLQLKSILAEKQSLPQQAGRGGVKSIPLTTVPIRAGVPVWVELSDLPHCADNPVQRSRAAPITVGELDLKQDRGFVAATAGNSKAAEFEFTAWASVHSYLHDITKGLELQLAAEELDRTSLSVLLTHLQLVNSAANTRLDYLRLRGEYQQTRPELVTAVEERIRGTTSYPITSPEILTLLGEYQEKTAQQALKASSGAQRGSPRGSQYQYQYPPRGGRASGPRGRDGSGGGRHSQERGLGPYHFRDRASAGPSNSGGS